MNYFESELRKLFEDRYPDATFVGRHCYVPLSDETRANICFKTSGYADHYDTLSVKVVDRKQGTIDAVDIKLLELIGMKKSPSPHLADGVSPHIWVNGGKAEWYGFRPSAQDYDDMRNAASDYMEVFADPEYLQSSGMTMTM